jgi:hypothetical protein
MVPGFCRDHRLEKVTEHQSYQSSHVNGAVGALIAVNLLLSHLGLNFGRKFFSGPLDPMG